MRDRHTQCPMDALLRLLMGPWTTYILWVLRTTNEPVRFGELKRRVPGISAKVLTERTVGAGTRPVAVVGRDPRASGEFLHAALSAGLACAGVDVVDVGVVPTPAVAYLTDLVGADLGAVISASHNPMPDNGIKFFSRGGHKLDDAIEDAIESRLEESWDRPTGAAVGRVHRNAEAAGLYERHLLTTVPHPLDGITVVVERLLFILRENSTREPEVVEKMLESVEKRDIEGALAIGKKFAQGIDHHRKRQLFPRNFFGTE